MPSQQFNRIVRIFKEKQKLPGGFCCLVGGRGVKAQKELSFSLCHHDTVNVRVEGFESVLSPTVLSATSRV